MPLEYDGGEYFSSAPLFFLLDSHSFITSFTFIFLISKKAKKETFLLWNQIGFLFLRRSVFCPFHSIFFLFFLVIFYVRRSWTEMKNWHSANIDRRMDAIQHGFVVLTNAFADRDSIRRSTGRALMEPLWKWLIKTIVTILVDITSICIGATNVRTDASLVRARHHAWQHTIGHSASVYSPFR